MADQAALKRAFTDFAVSIARPYDVGEVLYRLTDHAIDVLRIDGAGLCVGDMGGKLQFVTATDELVTKVEHIQVSTGQGPCHQAFHTGDVVTVSDLKEENRWPQYTGCAVAEGLRAAAGIPVMSGDLRIGALNLYVREPRDWAEDEIHDARLLGVMASGYLLNSRAMSAHEQLAAQLQRALDTRIVIEQAKGALAERNGIDTAASFELLRRHARNHSIKIHDVARAVVEKRLEV